MKKVLAILLLVTCAGCVSVQIPKYIDTDFSYKKNFYASFEETEVAVEKALKDKKWTVTERTDPGVYEKVSEDVHGKQLILFTEPKQTSMIISTRYTILNVLLRELDANATEVEIRYYSVTPVIRKFRTNKNDHFADQLFAQVADALQK